MKLKEKKLRREIDKYINDSLFDISIDLGNGTITCDLKKDIKKTFLKTITDNYNHEYTVLNLISLSDIKKIFPDCQLKKIDYRLSYNNALGENVIIKSDDSVTLYGIWNNIERLKVESQNILIEKNSKIVPNVSLNFASKKTTCIDSSIISIKSIGVAYICCDELTIKSSDLIFQNNNLVAYSPCAQIYDSYVCAKNMYLINMGLTVEGSQINIENTLDIKSNQLNLYTTDIFSGDTYISFKNSDSKDESINVKNSIVINGKTCESINNFSLNQSQNESKEKTNYELFSNSLDKTKVKRLNN